MVDVGYLTIYVYGYNGNDTKKYFCELVLDCIPDTHFTEMTVGNISGFMAIGFDRAHAGTAYFGHKGSKFYIISSTNYSPSSDFDADYKAIIKSMIF